MIYFPWNWNNFHSSLTKKRKGRVFISVYLTVSQCFVELDRVFIDFTSFDYGLLGFTGFYCNPMTSACQRICCWTATHLRLFPRSPTIRSWGPVCLFFGAELARLVDQKRKKKKEKREKENEKKRRGKSRAVVPAAADNGTSTCADPRCQSSLITLLLCVHVCVSGCVRVWVCECVSVWMCEWVYVRWLKEVSS